MRVQNSARIYICTQRTTCWLCVVTGESCRNNSGKYTFVIHCCVCSYTFVCHFIHRKYVCVCDLPPPKIRLEPATRAHNGCGPISIRLLTLRRRRSPKCFLTSSRAATSQVLLGQSGVRIAMDAKNWFIFSFLNLHLDNLERALKFAFAFLNKTIWTGCNI